MASEYLSNFLLGIIKELFPISSIPKIDLFLSGLIFIIMVVLVLRLSKKASKPAICCGIVAFFLTLIAINYLRSIFSSTTFL